MSSASSASGVATYRSRSWMPPPPRTSSSMKTFPVREHVRVVGLAQVRQARARDHERPAGVDLLHEVEALHLEVAHRGEVDGAGVVHDEVDAAKAVHGLGDGCLDR